MTTEIAVANKLGIALASDSAVTITGGGRVKIFDTADKLFELSLHHPIGVMINGNMDCLSIPWEILVKDFREKEGTKQRSKLLDWAKDFLAYIEGHMLISEDSINRYVESIIDNEIDIIQREVAIKIRRHIFANVGKKPNLDIDALVDADVKDRTEVLLQYPVADSLSERRQTIVEQYSDKIDARVLKRFEGQVLNQDQVMNLRTLAVEALLRAVPSDNVAGLVIAGYGSDETFPSIYAVEVDGRVAGRLKYTELESDSILTSKDGGLVTSYAQTDVIQRLLEGADPRFIETTAQFIEKAVTTVAETIEKAMRTRRISRKKRVERENAIKEIVELVKKEYEEETAKNLKDEFSREFDRMVAMMPKQELIELAEALVSITAVERKATSDEGTVGGLIDVAFITKHEGFVWVKRKHYFHKDLNPTYFWRRYGPHQPGAIE